MPLPPLRSFLLEPFVLLLSTTPLHRFLHKQDHFAPHPAAPFEGYYTRILTPSGSTILLIFSSVFSATSKPHFLHFSYLPRDPKDPRRIVVNKYPHITDVLGVQHANGLQEFSRIAKGDGVVGTYGIARKSLSYQLDLETSDGPLSVTVDITNRTPWSNSEELSTPEGIFASLVYLLPLHWNVFSTRGTASYSIRGPSGTESGTGLAHSEKNWGVSFPTGWTWLQGFHATKERTFAMAGGKIMGQKAYLLGYRSEALSWSFTPLWTLLPFGIATPFARETLQSEKGRIEFDVCNLTRRIVVEASAPPPPKNPETWLGLHCPLADGHGNTAAHESFEGVLRVRAYKRTWTLGWELVEETVFEDAAVEFGGDYHVFS